MARRDDPGVETWSLLLRAHAATVRRIEDDLSGEAGLPLAWYDVMLELSSATGGRLRMNDLAGAVVLSRSRVSRVVDELVEADLVRREPNPADRRSSFAAITPEGRRRFRRAAPVYLRAIDRHFTASLSPSQLSAVGKAMARVLERAAAAQPPTAAGG